MSEQVVEASSDHQIILGERFAARYEPEPNTGCWLWTGPPDSVGYGVMSSNGKQERSHRLSWKLHNGPIPAGLFVCHRCDNRACVNPRHLFLGAAVDNVRDMWAKGRASSPPIRKPTYPKAFIDAALSRCAAGEPAMRVARDVGISHGYLCLLVNGQKRDCDV